MGDEFELIQEVLNVERRWVEAHHNLDLDSIRDILADDYRQIQSDGRVIGKNELLQSYSSGLRNWEIAESDDYEVRMLGSVELLIGRWKEWVKITGKPSITGQGY